MTRPTTTHLDHVEAACEACPWRGDANNALGLAAQHHDRTGHPVSTTVTRTVRYGDDASLARARENAGQASLLP